MQHNKLDWPHLQQQERFKGQQERPANTRTTQLSEASSDEDASSTDSSSTGDEDSSDVGEDVAAEDRPQLPDSESTRRKQLLKPPLSPVVLPTLSIFSSSSSSTEEETCSPPPMLEPAVVLPLAADAAMVMHGKKLGYQPPQASSSSSKRSEEIAVAERRRVECGSQTVESIFPCSRSFSPSSSCPPVEAGRGGTTGAAVVSGGATPPRLFGFGNEPGKINRGRPRKNPPMLKPEIGTNEESSISSESDSAAEVCAITKVKKLRRKRDKLSVLYKVAKHWPSLKSDKKDGCDNDDDGDDNDGDVDGDVNYGTNSASSQPQTSAADTFENPYDGSKVFPEASRELRGSDEAEKEQESEDQDKQEVESEIGHADRGQKKSQKTVRHSKVKTKHRRPGGLSKGKNVKIMHHKRRRRRRHTPDDEKMEEGEEQEESRMGEMLSEKKRRLKKKLKRKEQDEQLARSRKRCRCTKEEQEEGGQKNRGFKLSDEKRQRRRKKATGCLECCAEVPPKMHRKKTMHKDEEMVFASTSRKSKSSSGDKKRSDESEEDGFEAAVETTAVMARPKKEDRPKQPARSEVETKEEIIRTIFTSQTNSKNYFNPADYESTLLFPKQYCNLRPDRFWKRPKASSISLPPPEQITEPSETAPSVDVESSAPTGGAVSATTAVFTTKASLKEMPPGPYGAAAVPRSQVQQMLRVLKDASKGASSGRRRKEAAKSANNEESQLKEAAETAYEVGKLYFDKNPGCLLTISLNCDGRGLRCLAARATTFNLIFLITAVFLSRIYYYADPGSYFSLSGTGSGCGKTKQNTSKKIKTS